MSLVLDHVQSPTEEARTLIDELETELSAKFPAEQRHGYDISRLFAPDILFFVARLNGEAVGCGGIAFEHSWGELKRMYVRPPARGRRIGDVILSRLEMEARNRKVARLVLETGDALYPAIRLYKRAGFVRCEAFGTYTAMPPRAIERSVFLEKRLG